MTPSSDARLVPDAPAVDERERAREQHWGALTLRGDPERRLNPHAEDFDAGWDAALAATRQDTGRGEADLHNALLEIKSDWSDWDEAAALKRVLQIADDALVGRPDYPLALGEGEPDA